MLCVGRDKAVLALARCLHENDEHTANQERDVVTPISEEENHDSGILNGLSTNECDGQRIHAPLWSFGLTQLSEFQR